MQERHEEKRGQPRLGGLVDVEQEHRMQRHGRGARERRALSPARGEDETAPEDGERRVREHARGDHSRVGQEQGEERREEKRIAARMVVGHAHAGEELPSRLDVARQGLRVRGERDGHGGERERGARDERVRADGRAKTS